MNYTDEVIIKNLSVHCVIGAHDRERTILQPLFLSFRIGTNFQAAANSDLLSDCRIDYSKQIQSFVIAEQAHLLEHLAQRICSFLFSSEETIQYIDLKIKKPSAIPLAEFAAIRVIRQRSDFSPNTLNTKISTPIETPEEDIYLGIGTNSGDRSKNISEAISRLEKISKVTNLSFLYETNPKYFTEQPQFLNCVCKIHTKLEPVELLGELKKIEQEMGRKTTQRYGPRVIDLDILFYGKRKVLLSNLIIPHPQLQERDFVIAPLLENLKHIWDDLQRCPEVVPVWVCPIQGKEEHIFPYHPKSKSILMGVINITPDSFSDGGDFSEKKIPEILESVKQMIEGSTKVGAKMDILDIGGESTRPGAEPVSVDEELARVIPVIKALREQKWFNESNVLISIDTSKSKVASESLQAGANIINDTTAGKDPNMFRSCEKVSLPD